MKQVLASEANWREETERWEEELRLLNQNLLGSAAYLLLVTEQSIKKNSAFERANITKLCRDQRLSRSNPTERARPVIPAHERKGGLSLASYAEWKRLLAEDEYMRSRAHAEWLDKQWRLQEQGDLQGDASDG